MDIRANKRQIRQAINKLYNVKCSKVNTVISPLGFKKAFVRMRMKLWTLLTRLVSSKLSGINMSLFVFCLKNTQKG